MTDADLTHARRALASLTGLVALGCAGRVGAPAPTEYTGFGPPQAVTVNGYSGDVMEPFVTRDGRYLLFNNSNDPSVDTDLHYAERVDDLTFTYRGPVTGANSASLDGVPSVDRDGHLYFVSTRSYAQTLSTIYSGRFAPGMPVTPDIVPGISRHEMGIVNFDSEISADGNTLYFVDGRFDGGAVPRSADFVIAVRGANGFERVNSTAIFAAINTDALEYAAAISADGLEFFFTRLTPGSEPAIYRAVRTSVTAPFDSVARVAAINGFAEAATFSADGRALYYHKRDGARFRLYRVSRGP